MKKLYQPFTINKLEVKNRIIMSPMSVGHTVEGEITDSVVEFYKRRAKGGVGLIIFANMQWDKERYNPNHGALLTDEKYQNKVAKAICSGTLEYLSSLAEKK